MSVDEVLKDAVKRLGLEYELDLNNYSLNDVKFNAFPQTWSSTSLGFGGMGGQSVTTATTIVVWSRRLKKAIVYFAGGFAYEAVFNNKVFEAICAQRMPGKTERGKLL